LSEVAQKKLERSNEFEYMRRLRNKYGSLGAGDSFIDSEYSRLNISEQDLQYDDKTALPDDVQIDEIYSMIDGLQGDDLLETLIGMRRVSEGTRKALLTDTIIGKLVKSGTISDATGDQLKQIEWDSATKTFKISQGAGSGAGKKKDLDFSDVKVSQPKKTPLNLTGPTGSSGSGSAITLKKVNTKLPKSLSQSSGASLKLTPIQPKLTKMTSSLSGLGQI
jgi:hypothetical protein